MVWKCVHGVASAYLSDLCVPATAISGNQYLRSAVTGTLLVPCAQTATGQWSLAVSRPPTWNRLPPTLQSSDLSESAFKRALKMHLFSTTRRHWDVFMILAPDINIQTYLLTYLLPPCSRTVLCQCAVILAQHVGTFSKWHSAVLLLSPVPTAPAWRCITTETLSPGYLGKYDIHCSTVLHE